MAATIPVPIETVKNTLNLKKLTRDDLFDLHKNGVLIYLQDKTLSGAYAAATLETGDTDASRKNAFQLAYSFLMLSSTIEFLNLNTMGDGIIESTGMDSLQTRLLSNSSIEQKKITLEKRALEMLKSYLSNSGISRLNSLTIIHHKSFRATII